MWARTTEGSIRAPDQGMFGSIAAYTRNPDMPVVQDRPKGHNQDHLPYLSLHQPLRRRGVSQEAHSSLRPFLPIERCRVARTA